MNYTNSIITLMKITGHLQKIDQPEQDTLTEINKNLHELRKYSDIAEIIIRAKNPHINLYSKRTTDEEKKRCIDFKNTLNKTFMAMIAHITKITNAELGQEIMMELIKLFVEEENEDVPDDDYFTQLDEKITANLRAKYTAGSSLA